MEPKIEDTVGMREFSAKNSLRFISKNPDMPNTKFVHCACGKEINRDTAWFVMIANGTLLCLECATCNSCRREATSFARRLVCIDGLVLCYPCLQTFASDIEPPVVFKIIDPRNRIDLAPENDNNALLKGVPEALIDIKREDRKQYKEKKDKRQLVRLPTHDRARASVPDSSNPLITAPVYDAYRGTMDKVGCPRCLKPFSGQKSANLYTVGAMARVYHKKCFFCASCQEPLTKGIKEAGKHFEFCNCEPPFVWCTRSACKQQRMEHHGTVLCWLGSIRPGGRKQNDTDLSTQRARLPAAKTQKTEADQ